MKIKQQVISNSFYYSRESTKLGPWKETADESTDKKTPEIRDNDKKSGEQPPSGRLSVYI